jgi:3-deoxy-D-manno-octulosonic-acid transferase
MPLTPAIFIITNALDGGPGFGYSPLAVYLLYSVLLFLALLLVAPAYLLKLRFRRKERLHLRERLGWRLPVRPSGSPFIWIHAVSVGEVLSLQSFVRELKARFPEGTIGVSTLTGSGRRMAEEKMDAADLLFYVPFDFAGCVRRVLNRMRPDLLILAESEFWPRLLREAGRRGVPILLANGRISTTSGQRMRRLRAVMRIILRPVTRFLVQTDRDRSRLIDAGIDPVRIKVAGNLKCEVRLPLLSPEETARGQAELGARPEDRLLVAGSIHPGEEGPLLEAFRKARAAGRPVRLILAPRHPEKFQNLEKDFVSTGLVFARRSQPARETAWDVLILDTIGELARFYALADAAFIGGSLVPWGGQNLLEPAFYGKPVFFGPHMDNFASLAEAFVRDGAARVVRTPEDLEAMFAFADAADLAEMGRRARQTLESFSGASEKTLAAVESILSRAF